MPIHFSHGPVKVYLVPKSSRHFLVYTPRTHIPCLHWCCGLYIKKLKVSGKQGRGHVEHICCHQEIDEHRLQNLVPEVSGEPAPVEDRTHADVVKWIESIEQSGSGVVKLTEPFETLKELLELGDFRLQLPPDV